MKKILLSALGIAALAASSANMVKADVLTIIEAGHSNATYVYDVYLSVGEYLQGGTTDQFGTLYNVDGTVTGSTGNLASVFTFSTGDFAGSPAKGQPSVPLSLWQYGHPLHV